MHSTVDQDEDLFTFAPDAPEGPQGEPAQPWRILIVDDNQEVHTATELALRGTVYKGRPLEFLSAFSAQQGSARLRHEDDIALVLLDVVMETQDAGLRLARHVREDLANHKVQIVLRTGQPGETPERNIISDYEINDYKSKNELTGTQLFTLVISALRAYESLDRVQSQHEALAASLSKIKDLESALDQHAIVAITDPFGRIVHANEKFCSISKFGREELVGRDHRILDAGVHPPEFFKQLWTTITGGKTWQGEICNCAKDGTLYWSAVTIVPFFNPDGKCYQYISIGTDITARKRSEQALRETEERWKFALDGAGDGVWDVNFETGMVTFSKRWKQMNGYPEDALDLRIDGWKNLIHPDDMAEVEANLRAYLTGKTSAFSSQHRSLRNDGSWTWVLDRGMVVKRNESGKPVRMVGTHTHIADPAEAQRRLESAAHRLHGLLDGGPVAVCIKRHSDQSILFANTAYGLMFPLDATGQGELDLAAVCPDANQRAALARCFTQAAGRSQFPLRLQRADGSPRQLIASSYPIDYDGEAATIAWFADTAPN